MSILGTRLEANKGPAPANISANITWMNALADLIKPLNAERWNLLTDIWSCKHTIDQFMTNHN